MRADCTFRCTGLFSLTKLNISFPSSLGRQRSKTLGLRFAAVIFRYFPSLSAELTTDSNE
jgi:hypothetical protein